MRSIITNLAYKTYPVNNERLFIVKISIKYKITLLKTCQHYSKKIKYLTITPKYKILQFTIIQKYLISILRSVLIEIQKTKNTAFIHTSILQIMIRTMKNFLFYSNSNERNIIL